MKAQPLPPVGTLMLDQVTGKLGEFQWAGFGTFYLRPVGGGVEWNVAPDSVRAATPEERDAVYARGPLRALGGPS